MALFTKSTSFDLKKGLNSAKNVLNQEFLTAIQSLMDENKSLKEKVASLEKGIVPKVSVADSVSYRFKNGNLNITLKTLDALVADGIVMKYDISKDGFSGWHPTQKCNGEKVWYSGDKLHSEMSVALKNLGYSLVDIYSVQSNDRSSWNTTVKNGTFKEDPNSDHALGFFTYKNKKGQLMLSSFGSLGDLLNDAHVCSRHALRGSAHYGARYPEWLAARLPVRER